MKSKYFTISENQDGTFLITTKKGRLLDNGAVGYEINPKQPRFIKIKHDGGAWCSLFNHRGCALKDTMWVNDVVLNDDGSYRVQEYMCDENWKHYNTRVSFKCFFNMSTLYVSGGIVASIVLIAGLCSKEKATEKQLDDSHIRHEMNTGQKVISASVRKVSDSFVRIHE